MPRSSARRSRHLTELLSEVYDADKQANNPRTIDFLDAGERLLCNDLLRETGQSADPRGRPPFEEVLAWLSRRRVVAEATRWWKPSGKPRDSGPTEAAYRYRWRTQAGYLRDLVIWALSPRMGRPTEIDYASQIIDDVRKGGRPLSDAISAIASQEVRALEDDQAFRLQMIFQATLAHDSQVADALCRIDRTHVQAWTEFARQSYAALGLSPRKGITFEHIGYALHAVGEGVMLRSMLPRRADRDPDGPADPAQLLALVAKAIVLATADRGDDDHSLDQVLDQVLER